MDADEVSLIAELLRSAGMSAESESLEAPLPDQGESADDDDSGISLAGEFMLIYTFVGGAGHRAKARIEGSPEAEVRLNFDHAASASPKVDLQWAEIVNCVTAAGQHTATGDIDRRPPESHLIRPLGKGSSSIWNALSAWLRLGSA